MPLWDPRAPKQRLAAPPQVGNGRGVSYQLVVQAEWVPAEVNSTNYRLVTHDDVIFKSATGRSFSLFDGNLATSQAIPLTVQWIAAGHLLAISGVRYRDEIVDGHRTSAPTDFVS